jgi:hypothetical protein
LYTFNIEIHAEDGLTVKTYVLKLTRREASKVTDLLALSVVGVDQAVAQTPGQALSGVLVPPFSTAVTNYNLELENSVTSVQLAATMKDAFAVLKIGLLSPYSKFTVANKTSSPAISLIEGTLSTLRVEVNSEAYPNAYMVAQLKSADVCADNTCRCACDCCYPRAPVRKERASERGVEPVRVLSKAVSELLDGSHS